MLITIPSLNCVITLGDFLLAVRGNNALYPSVCLVREVIHPCHLRVSWWLTRDELERQGNLHIPPPVGVEANSNLFKCRVKEAFEDCRTLALINVRDVKDLAFVFHADTLEKQYVNCAGMTRVYFTRYRFHHDGRPELIDCRVHAPFSSTYVESYPSRIWFFLLEVKHVMEKMLNDAKQFQPCRKMTTMKCSLECWHYFTQCMCSSDAVFSHYRRNHTDKFLHCDLSLSSCSTKKELNLVRIDSSRSMRCARNLFGTTFGIGIRNRAPRRGERPVLLHHGDVVNLVDVAGDGMLQVNRLEEFVPHPGIDFLYDSSSRLLKIRVRYSRFLAESNCVSETLQLSNPVHHRVERQNHLNDASVIPGTFFRREGAVVEVIAVNGNVVTVQEDETLNEYNMSLHEAARLISDYLE
jgi:hypothetical protein